MNRYPVDSQITNATDLPTVDDLVNAVEKAERASFLVACSSCGWTLTAYTYTSAVSAHCTHQELSPSCAPCHIEAVSHRGRGMSDEELLRRIREYAQATSQAADYRSTSGQVESAHAADGLASIYYYEIRDELQRRRSA